MTRLPSRLVPAAATLALAAAASAQSCYEPFMQCWSFAPRGSEVQRIDSPLQLRSKELTVTGDIRLRIRAADTTADAPYGNPNEHQATRARVQMRYQATDKLHAKVEMLFAESWAGSEPYSDVQNVNDQPNEQYNKVSMAYFQGEDVFGLGEKFRVGRSDYFLSNGLILGTCDFLQYPSTFTGAWLSRRFGPVDVEGFLFDDYAPLQAADNDGTRYAGGTAKWSVCDEGPVQQLGAYYLQGTRDGDQQVQTGAFRDDHWYGVEGRGTLPLRLRWAGEAARRIVAGGEDVAAYRMRMGVPVCSWLDEISITRTDSEGALQINPGDFNSAGLLHQYTGAWRSDLDTWQLAFDLSPGAGIDVTLNFVRLDHDGANVGAAAGINRQLGDFETDVIVAKQFDQGFHTSVGYGIDNDDRQVLFTQLTVYF
jgi:hypothetical protein